MYEVEADPAANRLTIRFSGRVDPRQTRNNTKILKTRLFDLKPEFRLLVDMSKLESMDPACAPDIEHAMDLCDTKGVAKVVRVIPDPSKDIGLSIMSMFHYRPTVRIVTCETLAEAERAMQD